ncbi:MAG: transcription repressor NadR [Bacilli bacterium]|nr:transcription repressor NadR [Bacilli bacterium]
MNRKDQIIEIIKKSDKPISASTLAKQFNVSRQIIVGDIALIRASGTNIVATPRGYLFENPTPSGEYVIAVQHNSNQLADELYTIIDLGGSIINVSVEHPIYGQLSGNLHLYNRYDVDQFIKRTNKENAKPLSCLTEGIHLHTIRCYDQDIYNRIIKALDEKGILLKKVN